MKIEFYLGKSTFLILSLSLLLFISCKSNSQKSVVIACAANVQFAMEELSIEFEKANKIKTSIIVASSGKLTAQIIEGAPYDVFISADMRFPEEVYRAGKGLKKPEIYAFGRLMLYSIYPNISVDLDSLSVENIKHIAVANPKTAPYGRAAKSALQFYNLYDVLKDKFVYGESVSQTNQFISTGAAEVGFTSYSSLKAFNNSTNYFLIDSKSHEAIEQGVILVKNKENHVVEAEKFYLFLFSQKGREVLTKYGYQLPEIN